MGAGSELIQDLEHVPEIVGGLGLSIAVAQHALNADYLDSVNRILAMTKAFVGDAKLAADADKAGFMGAILKQLAPSRYQFTETTLAVRLNLAQRMDLSAGAGLGLGYGGVSVNASFALAYGFDYQAAAECRTTLHAYPADGNVMDKLLARATTLAATAVNLPPQHTAEKAVIDQATAIFYKLTGTNPATPVNPVPAPQPAIAPAPQPAIASAPRRRSRQTLTSTKA